MRIALRAIEGEPTEPSLLGLDAARAIERHKDVRDTGARGRRGSSDGCVERAVERLDLGESIGLRVPRSSHDDLSRRRSGSKLPKDRLEARRERSDRASRLRALRRQRSQVATPQRQGDRTYLPRVSSQEGRGRLELGSAERVVQLEAVAAPATADEGDGRFTGTAVVDDVDLRRASAAARRRDRRSRS
jgi:hypothetical protein